VTKLLIRQLGVPGGETGELEVLRADIHDFERDAERSRAEEAVGAERGGESADDVGAPEPANALIGVEPTEDLLRAGPSLRVGTAVPGIDQDAADLLPLAIELGLGALPDPDGVVLEIPDQLRRRLPRQKEGHQEEAKIH